MPSALIALEPVEGVEVHAAPVAGVVWDRGTLLRFADGVVTWSLPLDVSPRLMAFGRRLYVAFDDLLACLDLLTGSRVWMVETGGPVAAMAAHANGVDVLVGAGLLGFDGAGAAGPVLRLPAACGFLTRGRLGVYVGGTEGVWRVDARAARVSVLSCAALYTRDEGVQALVDGGEGTLLVEDEGLPLVWSFPERARHLLAPYGRSDWAVAPREGRGGVWIVDRRVHTRWHVPLPGLARALAVVGSAVAVLVDDGDAALALTHRDVSSPLLLAASGAEGLHAEGDLIYLTFKERTALFRVREA